jgi:hypothetical protein
MAGGGVGEAMLISAAVGAGTGAAGSAIQGGDPLKGALMGGVTGAIGGGVMGGLNAAAAPTASTALSGASGSTGSALGSINPAVAGGATVPGAGAGSMMTPAANSLAGTSSGLSSGASNFGSMVPPGGAGAGSFGSISAPASAPSSLSNLAPSGTGSNFANFSNLSNTQLGMVGAGSGIQAAMAADRARYGMPSSTNAPYDGPLKRFQYDPNKFKPSLAGGYASGGGITDLDTYASNDTNPGSYLQQPVTMMASGGISSLGSYSDGGRLLRGPGDGMSDHIPASIGRKQPARLADGEFVVPADVVSHLGNGSTDAGAKQLYAMMNKVRTARTGNPKQGKEINPKKYLKA